MIGLTITTCKRIDLFEKTIISFVEKCEDFNLIDIIIHYDDSSSLEDRNRMFSLLNTLFPETLIVSKRFNVDSFNTSRRHLEIMKKWKEDIKFFNINYVFHLEDDWFFENSFNIHEGVELLKNNDDVGMVGFSWKKKIFGEKKKNSLSDSPPGPDNPE